MIQLKSVTLIAPVQAPPHGLMAVFTTEKGGGAICESIERTENTVTIRRSGKVIDVPWAQCRSAERASAAFAMALEHELGAPKKRGPKPKKAQ